MDRGRSWAFSRRISRSMAALSPTSTEAIPCSRAATTAPSTTTAGPKSPPIASSAIFMGAGGRPALLALDGQYLAPLVEAAVRADLVRQLCLAALRADGPRGGGHLVVGAALAATGAGVASLGQRHGRGLLSCESVRQALQRRPARIGPALGATAGGDISVAAAHRAESPALLAAERLHGQHQVRLRLHQGAQVQLILHVHVGLEIVGAQLTLLGSPGRRGEETGLDFRGQRRDERLEAPPANLGRARPPPTPDENGGAR